MTTLSGDPKIQLDDPRYVKALAHPLRIRILAMLGERAASPVQLAQKLDATLGTIAYHVRTLHNLGLIELVATRQRRGATEHVYQAVETPRFSDDAWEGLGPVAKQRLLTAMLRQIGEYVNGSAAVGGFDRSDANISRMSLKLDERGWKQLARASKKWLAEVDRIQEAAAARIPGRAGRAPALRGRPRAAALRGDGLQRPARELSGRGPRGRRRRARRLGRRPRRRHVTAPARG